MGGASLLALLAMASPLNAQPVPPRVESVGGIFGGNRPIDNDRSSQRLALDVSVCGGYNADLEGEPINQTVGPRQTGYVTVLGSSINYQVGTTARSFNAQADGQISRASGGIRDMQSAATLLRGSSTLGPRMGITADAAASYQPTFLYTAVAPIPVDIATPTPAPTTPIPPSQGVAQQRWLSFSGSGAFFRDLTPRQRAHVSYTNSRRRPTSGIGFESASQVAALRHEWRARQTVGLEFNYRFDENQQDDAQGPRPPLRYQSAEVSTRWSHSIAPGRAFELTVGGGATYARSVARLIGTDAEFVSPTATIMSRFTGRRWSWSADGRRRITVLEGLSPEPFLTDAATTQLDGQPWGKIRVLAMGNYSHGRSEITETGEFEGVTGLAQVRYQATRYIEISGTYNYYAHRLFGVEVLQPAFPRKYTINAARVGVTFWLPLYGAFRE
jgi:hypothetical protein